MHVTPEFHDYIHNNTGESYANGWLVKSWQEPTDKPAWKYVLLMDGWHLKDSYESAAAAGVPSEAAAEGTSDKNDSHTNGVAVKCPRCHGTGAVPPAPPPSTVEKPRQRKTLGIRLPKDADENGIEVLETLLTAVRDELKGEMGWKDNVPAYYVLVAVLHDWLTGRVG
jgi:hypothetical protein